MADVKFCPFRLNHRFEMDNKGMTFRDGFELCLEGDCAAYRKGSCIRLRAQPCRRPMVCATGLEQSAEVPEIKWGINLREVKLPDPTCCGECDYTDSDMRCMCSDSQWRGAVVKPDNYCMHGILKDEEVVE